MQARAVWVVFVAAIVVAAPARADLIRVDWYAFLTGDVSAEVGGTLGVFDVATGTEVAAIASSGLTAAIASPLDTTILALSANPGLSFAFDGFADGELSPDPPPTLALVYGDTSALGLTLTAASPGLDVARIILFGVTVASGSAFYEFTVVPEPTTALLVAAGLLASAGLARARRRSTAGAGESAERAR